MKERQIDDWKSFISGFNSGGYIDSKGIKYEKVFSEISEGKIGCIRVTTSSGEVSIHPCNDMTDMCMEDTAWNIMRKDSFPRIPDKSKESTQLSRRIGHGVTNSTVQSGV